MKSTRPPKLSESRLTGSFISANTNKDAAGTSVSSQSGLLKELKTLDKLERPRRIEDATFNVVFNHAPVWLLTLSPSFTKNIYIDTCNFFLNWTHF